MTLPERLIVPGSSPERLQIVENVGYADQALLGFLRGSPRVRTLLFSEGLIYVGDRPFFYNTATPEQEKADPRVANEAFMARVARHSVSVGLTMGLMMEAVYPGRGDLVETAREVMALHDLKKVAEIRWRKLFGSSDRAYDAAEQYITQVLTIAGFPPDYVTMAGSIGHNGARDFLTAPELWTIPRMIAYLADDLHQETIIQPDILAKVHRLQTDPRYAEANAAGFPERGRYPMFVNADGSLRTKYELQELATTMMAQQVAAKLGIRWQDLGKYLIAQSIESGLYVGKVESS